MLLQTDAIIKYTADLFSFVGLLHILLKFNAILIVSVLDNTGCISKLDHVIIITYLDSLFIFKRNWKLLLQCSWQRFQMGNFNFNLNWIDG